jgi:hypothetical protein
MTKSGPQNYLASLTHRFRPLYSSIVDRSMTYAVNSAPLNQLFARTKIHETGVVLCTSLYIIWSLLGRFLSMGNPS